MFDWPGWPMLSKGPFAPQSHMSNGNNEMIARRPSPLGGIESINRLRSSAPPPEGPVTGGLRAVYALAVGRDSGMESGR